MAARSARTRWTGSGAVRARFTRSSNGAGVGHAANPRIAASRTPASPDWTALRSAGSAPSSPTALAIRTSEHRAAGVWTVSSFCSSSRRSGRSGILKTVATAFSASSRSPSWARTSSSSNDRTSGCAAKPASAFHASLRTVASGFSAACSRAAIASRALRAARMRISSTFPPASPWASRPVKTSLTRGPRNRTRLFRAASPSGVPAPALVRSIKVVTVVSSPNVPRAFKAAMRTAGSALASVACDGAACRRVSANRQGIQQQSLDGRRTPCPGIAQTAPWPPPPAPGAPVAGPCFRVAGSPLVRAWHTVPTACSGFARTVPRNAAIRTCSVSLGPDNCAYSAAAGAFWPAASICSAQPDRRPQLPLSSGPGRLPEPSARPRPPRRPRSCPRRWQPPTPRARRRPRAAGSRIPWPRGRAAGRGR